jgi:hypothetical protein
MEVASRLRQLLPHWIEHNESHLEQLREWEAQARAAGLEEAADKIALAGNAIGQANEELANARELLPQSELHEH